MNKIAIIGCGYSGRVLARRLVTGGVSVRATTTSETRLASLSAMGAEAVVLRNDEGDAAIARGLADTHAVVYLAPPKDDDDFDAIATSIANACPSSVRSFVYGSSTGVYGHGHEWVDESTPVEPVHDRGKRRVLMETALAKAGLPLKILRIAGIYGPGRTLRASIERDSLILFDGAPKTSRIHVDDLARLLEAMTDPGAPDLVLACDDEPTPTLDVARYTCRLLGRTAPEPINVEDAKRIMSPTALEFRLGGHQCRSTERPKLLSALLYPTYREGVRASLEAEGALRSK